jgi:hypothetical protein
MYKIPNGVVTPVFMREPFTRLPDGKILHVPSYRLVDLSEAKDLCKRRVARRCGTIWRKIIDGTRKSQREIPVYELKRNSGAFLSLSGESARLTRSEKRPDRTRLLDDFACGRRQSRRMFLSRKTMRHTQGVPHELTLQTAERALLFFPAAGQRTSILDSQKGANTNRVEKARE